MVGGLIASAAVVNADEVVRGTLGVGHVAAVEEDDRDLRALEVASDAAVGGVLVAGELKWSKKDACHLLADEGGEHLFGFPGHFAEGGCGVSPEECIGTGEGGAHHSVADGLEDLREAEFGDKEPKGAALRLMLSEDVSASAGAAGDEAHALEIEDGFGDGDA